MAAGAGRDEDQPIRALLDRLVGEAIVDHVVQRDAAPAMHGVVELGPCAEGRDHDRRLPLGAGRHVMLQARIGAMDDLVDREGRRRRVRMIAVPGGQFLGDLVEPFVEPGVRPGVERREGADDPRLALGDDQVGHRDDEQRRSDDGKAQAIEERGQSHGPVL